MISALAPEGRISGFDGLRVLAVLVVVLYHQQLIGFGWAGVQFFFVLSGYLITRLLWSSRDQALGSYLKSFYGRRSLRIFPLYYAFLAVLAVAALTTNGESAFVTALPYLASYTFNLWSVTDEGQGSIVIDHLWSLCVEEQFYLVWPFAIFCFRSRGIRPLLLVLILLGPLVRWIEAQWALFVGVSHPTDFVVYVLTPTHVDAFAMGAYVALFPLGGMRKAWALSMITLVVAVYLAFSFAPGLRDTRGMGPGYILIWGYSLLNLCAALTIDCLAYRKLAPGFFDSRPMVYLGGISYGLYVFHMPVQVALEHALPQASAIVRLALQIPITIVVAALSYRLWEKPFLNLKDRWFPAAKARVIPSIDNVTFERA